MPDATNTSNTATQTAPNIDINSPYTPRRHASVVSISINHPFMTVAKKIKNFLIHKQTLFSTSFTIKVTPIVAIVSLFGLVGIFGGGVTTAFNVGKTVEEKFLASVPKPKPTIVVITPTPGPIIVSRTGTIQATYQWQEPQLAVGVSPEPTMISLQNTIADASISAMPTPSFTPKPTPTLSPMPPVLHYILLSRGGSILFLTANNTIKIKNYVNHRVLITGAVDTIKNTLTIQKPEDIEILQ